MALLVHELFFAACRRYKDKTAVRTLSQAGCNDLTYGQLQVMIRKVAGFLQHQRISKGERCALCLENGPHWPAIYLGMAAAGITCVPLDTASSAQELTAFCAGSKARLIFCSPGIRREKISAGFPCPAIEISDEFFSPLAEAHELPPVSPDDIASLLYTSGTTGTPKGVLLSHRNLCSNALAIAQTGLCTARDNMLAILPLYHSYPFMITLLVPLTCGACVTYSMLGIKPRDLSAVMRRSRVSIFAGIPQLYALLHQRIRARIKLPNTLLWLAIAPLRLRLHRQFGPRLRIFASGGAHLDPRIAGELSRFFGIKMIEGYGLTETSPVDTLNPAHKIKYGSVGKPLPGVKVRIVSPLPSGEGEIAIQGPNVMAGYYPDHDETRRAINDGWFLTGDLGYLDHDGYLFVTGRKKEAIILGSGKTIYPEELEERYAKGPYIKEVFVYPQTQERFGVPTETLHALVIPDLAYLRARNESNIREKVRWELQNTAITLPPYKRILGFTIAKEKLPRTALGKIKRQEALALLHGRGEETAAPGQAPSDAERELLTSIQAVKVLALLTRLTKRHVTLDSNLELDLGMDSLGRVQFELEMEELFAARFPENAFDGIYTVRDVITRLISLSRQTGDGSRPGKENAWQTLLEENPSPAILAKIRTDPTFGDKFITVFFQLFFRCLFTLCFFIRVRKRAPLPTSGPLLICANHASYLDGLALFCSLPARLAVNTYFVGFTAILESPPIRWAMKPGRLLPISPDTNSAESLKLIAFLLRHGKTVCVFPEGQRSADGKIYSFKKGVGIMARELRPLFLPVFIRSYRAWPRQKRLPRLFTPISIKLGKTVTYAELESRAPEIEDKYTAIAEALRQEVISTGLT